MSLRSFLPLSYDMSRPGATRRPTSLRRAGGGGCSGDLLPGGVAYHGGVSEPEPIGDAAGGAGAPRDPGPVEEPPPDPAGAGKKLELPAERYPPAWRTWWGSLALAGGGLMAYLVLAQGFPGVAIAVGILVQSGGKVGSEEIVSRMVPFLPLLVAGATLYSLLFVAVLGRFGWLAPDPERRTSPAKLAGWVVLLSAACLAGQQGLSAFQAWAGVQAEEQGAVLDAVTRLPPAAFFLTAVIAAPVGEELFFRRFLFRTLAVGSGPLAAYVLSALAFALIHFNPPALLLYAWLAVCCTIAYQRTGTVWAAIAVHVLNNGVVTIVLWAGGGGG